MVVCCDLVSSPQLKMSTDRTETGSWQLLNTYSFVTSKTKKWCNLIKLIIFVGTYSVSRKWNGRTSWDFDTRFGQKCMLNGFQFCETRQNSDLHSHNWFKFSVKIVSKETEPKHFIAKIQLQTVDMLCAQAIKADGNTRSVTYSTYLALGLYEVCIRNLDAWWVSDSFWFIKPCTLS